MLVLKNTTSLPIKVKESGQILAANSSRTINAKSFVLYTEAVNNNTAFSSQITSGDIIVNVDGSDLSAAAGIRYLKTFNNFGIEINGVPLETVVNKINIQNAGAVTTNAGTVTVNVANSEDDFTGNLFKFEFTTDNDSDNVWLQLSHNNLSSQQTAYLIPFNCKLVAITVGSDDDGQNYDIEFYRLAANSNSPSLFYTQQTNNARYVTNRTVSNSNINFSQGDKVGVFCNNEHDDLIVTMWFKVTSSPVTDIVDNNNTDLDD